MDSGRYTQFMCNNSVCQVDSLREGVSNADLPDLDIRACHLCIQSCNVRSNNDYLLDSMDKGIQFHVIMSTYSKCYFK